MRPTTGAIRFACRNLVAAGSALILAGCATGLDSMPLPAPGKIGDGILLTAAFSNALNLPAKAKVKLNGADIGEVESISARNFTAYVTMRVSGGAALHVGATAELRSATPLGDVFVAIRPGPGQTLGTRLLRSGDTIALNSTSSAATVEELLGSAALLVNGGGIRRLVSIVNGAGSALGGRGEKIAALLHHSDALISKLNDRSAQIDAALRSTSDLAAGISARQKTLDEALAAAVPATSAIDASTGQLADLTDTVARITNQLNRFPSLKGTDTRSLVADLNRMSAVLNDIAVGPGTDLNVWNTAFGALIKLTSGPVIVGTGDVKQLAFGALPDKNFIGDPGFHGADGTDWHAAIGSLRYEWNLLLSRIYGPEHLPRR